jgi:hypothetical protein
MRGLLLFSIFLATTTMAVEQNHTLDASGSQESGVEPQGSSQDVGAAYEDTLLGHATLASSSDIDSGIKCYAGCLDGDNAKQCAKSCSSKYGITKTDWQDAFVERCSPPPSADRAQAECVIILSVVSNLD